MSFLLDTNVVSEWARPRPDAGVVAWLREADEDLTFISAVTIAELRYGIERLPSGARRTRLDDWLTQQLSVRFEKRVLPVDLEIGDLCGHIMARAEALGRPPDAMDAFIAATAIRHDFAVVTRNVSHFERLGVRIVNPWIRKE